MRRFIVPDFPRRRGVTISKSLRPRRAVSTDASGEIHDHLTLTSGKNQRLEMENPVASFTPPSSSSGDAFSGAPRPRRSATKSPAAESIESAAESAVTPSPAAQITRSTRSRRGSASPKSPAVAPAATSTPSGVRGNNPAAVRTALRIATSLALRPSRTSVFGDEAFPPGVRILLTLLVLGCSNV